MQLVPSAGLLIATINEQTKILVTIKSLIRKKIHLSSHETNIVYIRGSYHKSWALQNYHHVPGIIVGCNIQQLHLLSQNQDKNHITYPYHLFIFQCEQMAGMDLFFWQHTLIQFLVKEEILNLDIHDSFPDKPHSNILIPPYLITVTNTDKFILYMVWQFNSQNGSVKAQFAYLCTGGCCRLWNTILVKLCISWDDGANARNSRENRFLEYLAVTFSRCVGCQKGQQIFIPSGHFLILERAKNRRALSQVNKVDGPFL